MQGLPRTPAVYERKLKWRKLGVTDFQAQSDNSSTAEGLEDILDKQFQEEAELGICFKMTLDEAQKN